MMDVQLNLCSWRVLGGKERAKWMNGISPAVIGMHHDNDNYFRGFALWYELKGGNGGGDGQALSAECGCGLCVR